MPVEIVYDFTGLSGSFPEERTDCQNNLYEWTPWVWTYLLRSGLAEMGPVRSVRLRMDERDGSKAMVDLDKARLFWEGDEAVVEKIRIVGVRLEEGERGCGECLYRKTKGKGLDLISWCNRWMGRSADMGQLPFLKWVENPSVVSSFHC